MTYSKLNASAATFTRSRTSLDVCPYSGMCVTCLEGCIGLCEVGVSAYRGREVLYPQPFGKTTSASQKDYPIDLSHFNIMGSCVGAEGVEPDPDKAIFTSVDVGTEIGDKNKIKLKLPVFISALGSTEIAEANWEGLAIGAAISGTMIVIGENVCAMDPNAEFKHGKVVHSPNLERRVKTYRNWQQNGYGTVAIQANIEDSRAGVLEYAIEKFGVDAVEIKWGQGAKDIGGEVKLPTLERAKQLKERGYIVLPDPDEPAAELAFNKGAIKEFERHSRIGMVSEEGFYAQVNKLREIGAKFIFLKTGAYRPADLARALKYSSEAKIDLLTVDGAGGGTAMSPWRMMNEWGIPTVYIEALLYKFAKTLYDKGAYIPSLAISGGFTLEDQVFKGLSLGAPFVKAIGMARAPVAAAMVGRTIGKLIEEEKKLPPQISKYGDEIEKIFISATNLRELFGKDFEKIPTAAIGLITYFERLTGGLQQLMCGARKFAIKYISREDIVALTKEAAELTEIPYITEADKDIIDKILS